MSSRSVLLLVPVTAGLLIAAAAVLGSVPSSPTGDVGVDDGFIGDAQVGVEDTHLPAIARLEPGLSEAVRAAAADAERDGVTLRVTSGWRSEAYQQQLLDEAVEEYGSLAEARRWVSTPEQSRHVSGEAIDIGPTDAAYWMARHGAEHGLCQVYANEIWHYELLTSPGGQCPKLLPDSSSQGR